MLKLIFLLLLPGLLAELLRKDGIPRDGLSIVGSMVHGLFFDYLIFLMDTTMVFLLFAWQYEDLLAFLSRETRSVQDISLFALLLLVQLGMSFGLGMLWRMIRYRNVERAILRMTVWQKRTASVVLGTAFLFAVGAFVIKDSAQRQLVINEVCSRNDRVFADANGDYPDYIELYNPSSFRILLNNFGISDTPEVGTGVSLEEVILPPHSFYIVWLGAEKEGESLSISSAGETVYLMAPDGEIMDSVAVPALDANMSYARSFDGAAQWQVEVPSPLAANDAEKKHLDSPVFSADSGFYDEEFLLSIQGQEGTQIYYTLDSSLPNENATPYTGEILIKNVCQEPNIYRDITNVELEWEIRTEPGEPVDKAMIVRAIAVDEAGNTSDVVTKTYFVNMPDYQDEYVLSMVSNPEDLFGEDGIYVTGKAYDDWYLGKVDGLEPLPNYELRGREAEIETTVSLFHKELLMEQQAGLRIQGASERVRMLKRFSVFARKEYSGSRHFDYELFGQKMHSFFMRQDFEDAFVQSLVTNRSVGTLKSIPATVFVNGEYWYSTYLREKYSEDYLAVTYDVDREKVRLEEGVPQEIYQFLEVHDLSETEDFDSFCELIDLQSYIDHLAINIYLCNMDACEYKNYRIWKTTTDTGEGYSDGRWRWLLYDMDCISWNSIGYYGAMRHDIDSFAQTKEYAGVPYNQERVYKALRVNEEFCRRFVLTFMDLANTDFAAETVAAKIQDWGEDMSWNDSFFEKRFDGIVPALAREFQLRGSLEEIVLSVNDAAAGDVTINTVTCDLTEGSWRGRYYTDYPVTVTAIPREGYEFVGWRNGERMEAEEQITVQLKEGGCQWEAVFEEKGRK